ncbi:MAG: hypothetical protein JNM14_07145 [Ferruginibacter sp.]|nr:hypothetical protein [Ferruginibacter sp.]
MKKFLVYIILMILHSSIIAQADLKFKDLMQKGVKQLKAERKHDAAVQTFNEAIKLKPSYGEAYAWRGYTYLEKAELDAYKSDEDDFDYLKNVNWQSALKDFNKAIELYPSLAYAYRHRGMAYGMIREIKKALADLNKAMELDPADKEILGDIKSVKQHYVDHKIDLAGDEIDKGLAAKDKNRNDSAYRKNLMEAVALCTEALIYDAENSILFYYRAKALHWLSRYESADKDIKKALALEPGYADAISLQKQITEMIAYVKKADKITEPVKTKSEEPKPPLTPKPSVNSNDEIIRNLGTTLPLIVASATDPAKHFSELKGKKMKSRFYRSDTYHSSIELPGALETFVHEFTGNNLNNYYYWYALIDEEDKTENLNGKIKARYKAVCDELKLLYPDITPVHKYNNENYFSLKVSPRITIDVSYFYSAGYKDLVTLTVIAEHGK